MPVVIDVTSLRQMKATVLKDPATLLAPAAGVRWRAESGAANLWSVRRKRLGSERREGFTRRNLHASYVHLYFSTSEPALRPLLRGAKA